MRNIFISDIHGYNDEFQKLLQEVSFSKNDILYVLGDMIRDGDNSFEVLEYMRGLGTQCHAILGNHETAFLKNIQQRASKIDTAPIPEYERELARKILSSPDIYSYLQSLPHYIQGESFIGVHRGLIPGIPFDEQKHIIGSDESQGKIPLNWYEKYTGDKTVIYGHWGQYVYRKRTHFPNFDSHTRLKSICIDGGIKEIGGSLGAYILEENTLVLVPEMR